MAKVSTGFQYPFPAIPSKWTQEEKLFAIGLRDIFDRVFATSDMIRSAYPVGAVYLTVNNECPFTFGSWQSVTTGISGVKGFKRVK